MNLPKAYFKGFTKAGKSPRLIFILYLSNLVMALLLALPFRDFLARSFGSSNLSYNLLEGFDFTTFSNLIHYNSSGFYAILGSVKWILLIYFFFTIFVTGGVIRVLNRDKFSNAAFFSGATFNFFRFLGLSIIILFVQILFAIVIYLPLGLIIDSLKEKLVSELPYIYWIVGAITLHLFIFLLVVMIGNYAKFYLEIKNSFNIFKGFWKGVKYVFTYFFKTYILYLLLLILPVVIMFVYLHFEKDIKMATGIGILIVLAMQQGFVLLRVFLRVWTLASQFKLYDDDYTEQRDGAKDVSFSKFQPEPPARKTKKKDKAKKEAPVVEIEEQEINEEAEENSEYKIDFDKAFSDKNVIESDESSLTEGEMLEKVKFEDKQKQWLQDKNEEKQARQDEEEYNEEEYVEPLENALSLFEEDDTEEIADCEDDADNLIEEEEEFEAERVVQNVQDGILHSYLGVNEEDSETK